MTRGGTGGPCGEPRPLDPFRAAFDAIPTGYSEGTFQGRRWRITKSVGAGGKGAKLQAHELGGTGFVSLNLYALTKGDSLKPCEMSERWVRDFVMGVILIPQPIAAP